MIPKYTMHEDSTWGKLTHADCVAIKAACDRFWARRGRTAPYEGLTSFRNLKKDEKNAPPKALSDRGLENDSEKGSD